MWSTFLIVLLVSLAAVTFIDAGTSIKVSSEFKKEVNVKIQGAGVGGCDVILQPGDENNNDCWCLWGTINYSFCVYDKVTGDEDPEYLKAIELAVNRTEIVNSGRCPVVTGESLVCSDLTSLGNCYDHAYECIIDSSGLCHCQTV